jgi:hypothetical protein
VDALIEKFKAFFVVFAFITREGVLLKAKKLRFQLTGVYDY